MFKKIKTFLLMAAVLHANCSKVIDKHQQALYVHDYCPKIGVCEEGTHVMCTHYDPKREMGPLCSGVEKVSITPEYAEILLDFLNGIRSRAARGKTTGVEDYPLPRAYGMFRLQWDPELATMAQLWANQCRIAYDTCRATKKFPDPGQIAVITRFDANWIPVSNAALFNDTGFSLEKVKYGLQSAVRSWYRSRENIYPEDISDGNFTWPPDLLRNPYLQIVRGPATHTGCGISAFKEFSYYDSPNHEAHLVHNVIRVVCNLSSRLQSDPGKSRVYTIDPPTEVGYTLKCGCPLGYDEDEDCLCYESGRGLPYSCKDKQCKPHVVVLPVFTIENAPPHKYIKTPRKVETNRRMSKSFSNRKETSRSKNHDLRGSIFLKSSVFELPPRKLKVDNGITKELSKAVEPRKGFIDASLASRYLSDRNKNITDTKLNYTVNDLYRSIPPVKKHQDFAEDNRRIFSDNLTFMRNPNRKVGGKVAKLESDNNLLSLLNKLEEEAEHVQLNNDKIVVLGTKLKKIYETFMEKASRKSRNTKEVTDRIYNGGLLKNEESQNYQGDIDAIRGYNLYKNIQMPSNNSNGKFDRDVINTNLFESNFRGKMFNNRNNNKGFQNIDMLRKSHSDNTGYRNDNANGDLNKDEDLLSFDKRKFYQEKLNKIKRKLRDFGNYRHNKGSNGHQFSRPLLPTYQPRRNKLDNTELQAEASYLNTN